MDAVAVAERFGALPAFALVADEKLLSIAGVGTSTVARIRELLSEREIEDLLSTSAWPGSRVAR